MKTAVPGQFNLAALIGSSIGSITGLFAVGLAPAIIESDFHLILAHPTIGLLCFFVGGICGWCVGGLLGSRLARLQHVRQGYIAGGVIGGAIPFGAFVLLGWFLWTS